MDDISKQFLLDLCQIGQEMQKKPPDELFPVKYLPEPCSNCGRVRVELWTDGSVICEKCEYNQLTHKYERDYGDPV